MNTEISLDNIDDEPVPQPAPESVAKSPAAAAPQPRPSLVMVPAPSQSKPLVPVPVVPYIKPAPAPEIRVQVPEPKDLPEALAAVQRYQREFESARNPVERKAAFSRMETAKRQACQLQQLPEAPDARPFDRLHGLSHKVHQTLNEIINH
jgi:hypothetical protein